MPKDKSLVENWKSNFETYSQNLHLYKQHETVTYETVKPAMRSLD